MNKRETTEALARWRWRFDRSQAAYFEEFEDEAFSDLVAVLVAGTYIEALLWLAVKEFCGYVPAGGKKDLTLSPLIDRTRGLLGQDLEAAMRRFTSIRNDFGHDPDCKLERREINELEQLLPAANRATVATTLLNLPGYGTGAKARVIFMEIVGMVERCLDEANAARADGDSES